MEIGQAREAKYACLRNENGNRASKRSEKCLLEKRKQDSGKWGWRLCLLTRQKWNLGKKEMAQERARDAW